VPDGRRFSAASSEQHYRIAVPLHRIVLGKVEHIVDGIRQGQSQLSGSLESIITTVVTWDAFVGISIDDDLSIYKLPADSKAPVAVSSQHWKGQRSMLDVNFNDHDHHRQLQSKLLSDAERFLVHWLLNHVTAHDRKIRKYLSRRV